MHGLLSAPPGELRANPVLPALAEVLRAWARADDRVPGHTGQEQLGTLMAGLQDALASAFPQLFKQGAFACFARGFFIAAFAVAWHAAFLKLTLRAPLSGLSASCGSLA